MNGANENNGLKEKSYKICREFLQGAWKTVLFEDFRFDVIQGGLSNTLYRCALPEAPANDINSGDKVPKEILLRIYGPQQDARDFIIREVVTFTMLSERNLGPKLYGVFSDGRLEEYIPSKALDWSNLAKFGIPIAEEFAKIHALQVPIKKTPVFQVQVYDWLAYTEKSLKESPVVFNRDILGSGEYRREVNWLLHEIMKADPPVVFCHNDLQGGNILLMDSPGIDGRNIMFIDFEFSGYNYRGFDIGNHLSERCFKYNADTDPYTFEMDAENYPTKSEQIVFVDAYLKQLQKEGIPLQTDFRKERAQLLKEISLLRLAAHLYWSAWAFQMKFVSSIPFTFWEYGYARYDLYKRHKEEFLHEESQIEQET